ncbi:hypothetical protein Y032_0054g2520 [Ancylostoma ceylanicum]|uniref:Uncharacterized protein n=1 Tax=Ancylostoma ceylanicum TaxID=53326 RepID=A0A016U724_9BILA|nr:hypothetical protein Y032_0054g2520 [Ancylostoma ceylanicum]
MIDIQFLSGIICTSMETNRTLFDDVVSDDFPAPSTSKFVEDSPPARDLLIGDLPEIDPSNITGVASNATTFPPTHMLFENFFSTIESILEERAWLVYAIVGAITLIVIIVIVLIVAWIAKHKKRVIQQDNDPVLARDYNDGVNWGKCCFCCRSSPHKQSQLRGRQNSASNLDPYKRPPLPPIGVKPGDPYISTFNRIDALNGLSKSATIDEKTLAANIHSIRGVPHVHLRPDQYRNLPPLKMRYE